MVRRLIYGSSAVRDFPPEELKRLLGQSRVNNRAAGITGALLYLNGNFFQLLEGAAPDIEATFRRIECDRRHRGIIVFSDTEVAERTFPIWSMGFRSLSPDDLASHADLFRLDHEQFMHRLAGDLDRYVTILVDTFLRINDPDADTDPPVSRGASARR